MKKNKILKICETCGKRMELPDWKRYQQTRFCSHKCRGKSPELRERLSRYIQTRPVSDKLREAWRQIGLRHKKENNPHWRGGHSPERKLIEGTIRYKEWRKKVFKRDDYTCQKCGRRGGKIHAHHIKNFAEYPELRTDINNGKTLCRECHYKNGW